jgi:hypothetical protein
MANKLKPKPLAICQDDGGLHRQDAPAMIGLFIKRGWFWEVVFWLLILGLARMIAG